MVFSGLIQFSWNYELKTESNSNIEIEWADSDYLTSRWQGHHRVWFQLTKLERTCSMCAEVGRVLDVLSVGRVPISKPLDGGECSLRGRLLLRVYVLQTWAPRWCCVCRHCADMTTYDSWFPCLLRFGAGINKIIHLYMKMMWTCRSGF